MSHVDVIRYRIPSLPSSILALNLTFPNDDESISDGITYNQLAEAFVSGHRGVETFTELSILLVSVGLWITITSITKMVIRSSSNSYHSTHHPTSHPPTHFSQLFRTFLFEWFFMILPIVSSMTLAADHVRNIFVGQIILISILCVIHRWRHGYSCIRIHGFGSNSNNNNNNSTMAEDHLLLARMNQSSKQFLTNYRTSLMIGTSIAILAVDFTIFPRRYCKTETFGLGMMDGGVGSFIISHALTSIHARANNIVDNGKDDAKKQHPSSKRLSQQLFHMLRSILPLVILGLLRLFTIRAVDYQVHTSEYGVHWNFFFTLTSVAIGSGCLSKQLRPTLSGIIGFILLILYQFLLSTIGLDEWIFHAPRISLISANKEGLASSIGYFALYLIAVKIGSYILERRTTLEGWWRKVRQLTFVCLLLWCLTLLASSLIQFPSRRLVNLSYGLWMLALNLMLIIQFMVTELVIQPPPTTTTTNPNAKQGDSIDPTPLSTQSLIIESINKNSLPFFLLCNLCTGAVNLSIHTIFASELVAAIVMVLYTFVTCLVIVYVNYRGWILKL